MLKYSKITVCLVFAAYFLILVSKYLYKIGGMRPFNYYVFKDKENKDTLCKLSYQFGVKCAYVFSWDNLNVNIASWQMLIKLR